MPATFCLSPDPAELATERALAAFGDDEADRLLIAFQVLQLVGYFADDMQAQEAAEHQDIETEDGVPDAVAVEEWVRRLAAAAESRSLPVTGIGADVVVCGALARADLLDDYLRIREAEQHLAFDHPVHPVEVAAVSRRLEEKAAEAEERARWRREQVRNDARVCTCGEDYGVHRLRSQEAQLWRVGPRSGACVRFSDVDEAALRHLGPGLREKGVRSWASRHGVELDDDGCAVVIRALSGLRDPSGSTLRFGAAMDAVAAALELAPATQ